MAVVAEPKSFAKMLDELKECQWYWGAITSSTAQRLLKDRPAGTFLVRDSRSESSVFSFSYATESGIYHTRINFFNGRFCLGGPHSLIRAESLPDFVDAIVRSCSPDESLRVLMHPSMFMNPAAQPINILFPLRRNQFVPSLKGACRLAIRRLIIDNYQIHSLPLPKSLKKFVSASDYLLLF